MAFFRTAPSFAVYFLLVPWYSSTVLVWMVTAVLVESFEPV